MNKLTRNILFYSLLFAVWYSIARTHVCPPRLLPSPGGVAHALFNGLSDGSLFAAVRFSMKRVVIGYLVSVALGFGLGLAISVSKFLEDTLGNLLTSLQSLPSLSWLPLALLWFGPTDKGIYFVIIMGSVFSIAMSIETSRSGIPPIIPMAARNLGASGVQLYLHVLLPASLPSLISGLKQGWAFAWRGLISAEMFIVSCGLGQLLMNGRSANDMNRVFAVLVVILVIGWAVDAFVFRNLERAVARRWGLSHAA